jgi:hypothetical protein
MYIGLDDTDTIESRGTGHLARHIAADLSPDYIVLGVTRHQLLLDPRVPCTAKNSSAAIVLGLDGLPSLDTLMTRIRELVETHHSPGSDPGLCIADRIPQDVARFGQRVKREVVTQEEAWALAGAHNIRLVGLGGSSDGVIGALAAVGLAASGEDGRYVLVGRSRHLNGLQPVTTVLAAGIAEVRTADGCPVTDGLILTDKLRPARRGARPVAIVERCPEPARDYTVDYWRPLKLD